MKFRTGNLLSTGFGALISVLLITSASAQTGTPAPTHATHAAQDAAAAANTEQMQQELVKLRAQVQMLEQRSAVTAPANRSASSTRPATAMAPAATPGMGGRKMGMEREMPMKPAMAGTPMPMAPPGKMGMERGMPMPPASVAAAMPMPAAGGMEGEDNMPMAPAPAGSAMPMPSGGGMDMMQMIYNFLTRRWGVPGGRV